jgi:molybdopterin converting factor small subunit
VANLVEGIQAERKRVEELRKQYVEIGPSGQLALMITIDPALKEADASIASGDVVRMLTAYKELQGITG